MSDFHEGPPVTYVPVLRRPTLFPFHPGIVRYKLANEDKRAFCVVTGERIADRRPGE